MLRIRPWKDLLIEANKDTSDRWRCFSEFSDIIVEHCSRFNNKTILLMMEK